MSENEDKAWDLFRNIVSLAQGAEEFAAEAERAACCVAMPGIKGPRGSEHYDNMYKVASACAEMAMHYAIASGAYLTHLRALATKTGDKHAAEHLRNAKCHIEKAMKAERCAKEAIEAMENLLAGRGTKHPVCQMAGL